MRCEPPNALIRGQPIASETSWSRTGSESTICSLERQPHETPMNSLCPESDHRNPCRARCGSPLGEKPNPGRSPGRSCRPHRVARRSSRTPMPLVAVVMPVVSEVSRSEHPPLSHETWERPRSFPPASTSAPAAMFPPQRHRQIKHDDACGVEFGRWRRSASRR